MKRFGSITRLFRAPVAVLALALGFGAHATACGSDARATDMCRRVENERCAKAKSCPAEFPDFTENFGTVDSCQHFYDVQCGRGVQDLVKEPSRTELQSCLDAIKGSCDAARTPEKYCPFLTANDPPVTDTGTVETATDAATDAAADGG